VQEWDVRRTASLSKTLHPYIQVTDAYADLICEIVDVLGTERPSSIEEIVVRDLLADVFDSLHEARRIILTGKCSTAYPTARRVYESMSLLALCVFDPSVAKQWQSGKQISNSEVRRGLAKQILGEEEHATKELYNFFSLGAHPNRDLIPGRYLGEGNQFTLGAIMVPSLALVVQYCAIHLSMWFWFTATTLHKFHMLVDAAKPDLGQRYLQVARAAQQLQPELRRNYDRLLKEEREHHAKKGPGEGAT
jgi:hypothetical protein